MSDAVAKTVSDAVAKVEYIQDPDSHTWLFRVPSLHITGTAATKPEARDMAREAILFALEDCPW